MSTSPASGARARRSPRSALVGLAAPLALLLAGCNAAPRQSYIEWVARDAWDLGCAREATTETFEVKNRRWEQAGERYAVDVKATFKLVNPCESESSGKTYKAFQSSKFARTGLILEKCENKEGRSGWALAGKARTRCWTGPTLPQADYTREKATPEAAAAASDEKPEAAR